MSSINQIGNLHKLYTQYQIQKSNSESSGSSQTVQQSSMRNSFPMDAMSFSSEGMQALREERLNAMKTERSEALDALVEDGTITEDQKTAILDAFEEDFANMENNTANGMPPMGPPPGHGGGKPPMGPPPGQGVQGIGNNQSSSSATSTDASSELDENNPLKALLDQLLEEGTIDEEEQDALISIFTKQQTVTQD